MIICENPLADIGVTKLSETFLPSIFKINEKLLLVDCAGARDNRHSIISIANMINMANLMKKAQNKSILIVVERSMLDTVKG